LKTIFSLPSRQKIISVDAELQQLKERQRSLEIYKRWLVFQHYTSVPLLRLRRKKADQVRAAPGETIDHEEVKCRNEKVRS
jgi:hypothetical protein